MCLLPMPGPTSLTFNLGPYAPPYSDPTGQARKTDIAARSMETWTNEDIQFVLGEVLGATPRQLDGLTQKGVTDNWRSLKNYVHSYPLGVHGEGDLTSVQWADFLLFFRDSMLRAEEGPLDRNNLPDLSGILSEFLTAPGQAVSKSGELTEAEKYLVASLGPECFASMADHQLQGIELGIKLNINPPPRFDPYLRNIATGMLTISLDAGRAPSQTDPARRNS
ncbi:MAG: hypothetical protein Q7U75_07825 [Desulfobacterales bacterium]|nr:hypothetical protein [Desulfobacterales bacterium]